MENMTHTPGPWVCHSGSVWKPVGEPRHQWPAGENLGMPIARMDRDTAGTSPGERDANARLVAAAPELLEALRVAVSHIGTYADGDGAAKYHATNIARAAIAKATGQGVG